MTVTGSRLITSIDNSPMPIGSVSIGHLQATTPSEMRDAFNGLPQLAASRAAVS